MFNDGSQPTPIILSGIGGWNDALHPADISENELSTAYNMIFEPSSGKLVTRGGLLHSTVAGLSDPITVLSSFSRKPSEGWLVCASGSKLYYLDSFLWVELFTLESSQPTMKAFNGKLYVADGSVDGLLSWDGTTVGRVTDSPQATAVFEINNRLVCNSLADADLDAVYFSAVEDGDDWDVVGSTALIIRAGYGDGLTVNGFSAISKTLIVSKTSYVDGKVSEKMFYGVDTSADSANWSAFYVSKNNSAINPHCLVGIKQDVLYIDTQGIESLTPTQSYGDIANDPIVGGKVNSFVRSLVRQYADTAKVVLSANLANVFFILGQYVVAFSSLTDKFTLLEFSTTINHIVDHGDVVYLAGENGELYQLSSLGWDEVNIDDKIDFKSVTAFKMISGSGDLLLTKSHFDLIYLTAGTYDIRAASGERNETTLLQTVDFVIGSGDGYLHDADEDLHDATYDLGSVGTRQRIPCRGKFRGDGILIQISTKNYGRLSIGKATAMVKQVGR